MGSGFLVEHYREIAGKLTWVLGAAVLIALPAVTALLVINMAFGVMAPAPCPAARPPGPAAPWWKTAW